MLARFYQPTYLRKAWSDSKTFRRILIFTLIFFVLRLVFQVMLLGGAFFAGEEDFLPPDLLAYVVAAANFQQREPLYIEGPIEQLEGLYQYAPSFAMASVPALWIHPALLLLFHTLMHLAAYALLYFWWDRIFRRFGLERAREMLAWTLPVWLVFSVFWADLLYLNIYIPMALLGTWLIEAVLEERLGWSVLWLSIILQIKPQWAFAAAVPLLLRRFRFFFRLLALALVVYVAIASAIIVVAGPDYGLQQYIEYFRFLGNLNSNFPWRGPDAPFLGYNHSITQTVFYLAGISPETFNLAVVVKLLFLAPLAIIGLRHLIQIDHKVTRRLGLDWAFALYLGAFIWLDIVWEAALVIAIFPYLLAILKRPVVKHVLWGVMVFYALIDAWQIVSFLILGNDALSGSYVVTDPSIYIPLVMIVILIFYIPLLLRLWQAALPEKM